eukprot:scaffold206492_cov48-Attheya_sp.AAC.1
METRRMAKPSEEEEARERERMALVRSLQSTFYASPDEHDETHTLLSGDDDPTAGIKIAGSEYPSVLEKLPLWRVPWSELPGRSNVLSVHQPAYTHMFESILRSPPSEHDRMNHGNNKKYYVGHLCLPGGKSNLHDGPSGPFGLEGHVDYLENEEKRMAQERTAVIGTLLQIVDYRRFQDGKLLLLVQAVERFVVTQVHRHVPYSIATVEILPDIEECIHIRTQQILSSNHHEGHDVEHLPDGTTAETNNMASSNYWLDQTEAEASKIRAMAVNESFAWHAYEYDATMSLPIQNTHDISVADVDGTALMRVMPFVPYSSTIDPSDIPSFTHTSSRDQPSTIVPEVTEEANINMMFSSSNPEKEEQSLEKQLMDGGILRRGKGDMGKYNDMTLDELEVAVWMYIEQYVLVRKIAIPQELLCLLPANQKWPSSFCLEDRATRLLESSTNFVRVASDTDDYPSHRRQRRLSYAAPSLLERISGIGMRQDLLELHSTHSRLVYVCIVHSRCLIHHARHSSLTIPAM